MDYIIATTAYILKGCVLTLEIAGVTILGAVPLGIILALGSVSAPRPVKKVLELYAWIFRGTPLLLQLFFVYYGLTVFGISLSPMGAASLTFILNYAAYLMEIFRAGIQSVDKGQTEAAKALNMTYSQTMRRIILPQAIKKTLPPLCNETITLVKDTALVIVIGMGDMLRSAKEIFTRDFTLLPFFIAAVIYLALTYLIIRLFRRWEKRLEVTG